MSLDKVVKEKDELKDSNSQLKHCVNDLKASICALKETLVSHSCRAEIAENQNLILQLAELEHKLNSRPPRVTTVKARALVRKE